MKVLMSRDNKDGWKLEELLAATIEDLESKNAYLAEQGNAACSKIMQNNEYILQNLRSSLTLQKENLAVFEVALGKDGGPSAPRI